MNGSTHEIKYAVNHELGEFEALYKAQGVTEDQIQAARKSYCKAEYLDPNNVKYTINDYTRWRMYMDTIVAGITSRREDRMLKLTDDVAIMTRAVIALTIVIAVIEIAQLIFK